MPTALQVWAGGCPSQTKGRRRRVEWVSMEVSHAVALPLWWSLGLIFPEEWAGRRQITSYFKLEWWLMLGLCYNTTPWRKPPSWERPTCHWMGGLGADRRLFFSRSVCSAWNWVYPAFNTSSPFWCKNIYIYVISLFSPLLYIPAFSAYCHYLWLH